MNTPCIQLRCDSCLEAAFLYRLYGTTDALCARCFLVANPPEISHRAARMRTPGPAGSGCLRNLRTAPRTAGLHRVVRPTRRY